MYLCVYNMDFRFFNLNFRYKSQVGTFNFTLLLVWALKILTFQITKFDSKQQLYMSYGTVKYFLFARTLFSRKFARA